jgi:hypothetical protein
MRGRLCILQGQKWPGRQAHQRSGNPVRLGTIVLKLAVRKSGRYSIFTSGVYNATAPDVAFPQEKPQFAETDCAE